MDRFGRHLPLRPCIRQPLLESADEQHALEHHPLQRIGLLRQLLIAVFGARLGRLIDQRDEVSVEGRLVDLGRRAAERR